MAFARVVITFIDLDHMLILDKVTLPAIPAFYALGLFLPEREWWHGLVGAAVGYGVVRLIADGYYWLTKREGLGYGDGKLLAVVGALLGWEGVVASLFVGSMLGSVIGIGVLLVVKKRRAAEVPERAGADAGADADADADTDEPALRHTELPFGPFLAAGAIAYMFLLPSLHGGLGSLFRP
jgi:prepilin signal peptidase PulO-like enzyme (type II secretory pathway)